MNETLRVETTHARAPEGASEGALFDELRPSQWARSVLLARTEPPHMKLRNATDPQDQELLAPRCSSPEASEVLKASVVFDRLDPRSVFRKHCLCEIADTNRLREEVPIVKHYLRD